MIYFFYLCPHPLRNGRKHEGASMHTERNKFEFFNNLISIILKICEIALFTRATTPGSSLFIDKVLILISPLENNL